MYAILLASGWFFLRPSSVNVCWGGGRGGGYASPDLLYVCLLYKLFFPPKKKMSPVASQDVVIPHILNKKPRKLTSSFMKNAYPITIDFNLHLNNLTQLYQTRSIYEATFSAVSTFKIICSFHQNPGISTVLVLMLILQ